jgi:hypothetical protein
MAFGMMFIIVKVEYVGCNITKVSQSIKNMSHIIKPMGENINNVSVISKHSKKIRLKCKRIKCFE